LEPASQLKKSLAKKNGVGGVTHTNPLVKKPHQLNAANKKRIKSKNSGCKNKKCSG
jgi:hypothetical protein